MPKWVMRAITVILSGDSHAHLGVVELEFEPSFVAVPERKCERLYHQRICCQRELSLL